jgi:hypothetical protein
MDFGAYKILALTISVDVIPGVAELIYFLIIFAESRGDVNICWSPKYREKKRNNVENHYI